MRRLIAAACLVLGTALFAQDRDVGELLYTEGLGATAILAGGALERPATEFACADCHGDDARGNREGGTQFPPLLTGAEDNLAVNFSAQELQAVLEMGLTPDGRDLSQIMPRYRAEASTISALHGYLGKLARAGRVGVTARSLRIGPPTDMAAQRAFDLALMQANDAGGAWSRRYEVSATGAILVGADEAAGILRDSIDRFAAQAVAEKLSALGINVVAAEGVGDGILTALKQYGTELDGAANVRLRMLGEAVLLVADGVETEVFALSSLTTEMDGLTADDQLGYLVGREIAAAALACGRSITRRCVLGRLRTVYLVR